MVCFYEKRSDLVLYRRLCQAYGSKCSKWEAISCSGTIIKDCLTRLISTSNKINGELQSSSFQVIAVFFFFSQPLPLGCGVAAADTILVQPVLSWTSFFVVPMGLMSRLTQSIQLCFGLHRFLLPGGTISRVFLPT